MISPQTIIDNLAPVLAEIAATAAQREQDREFSRDLAKQLSAGGFTKLRIPVEFGGLGFSLPEAFEVLVAAVLQIQISRRDCGLTSWQWRAY